MTIETTVLPVQRGRHVAPPRRAVRTHPPAQPGRPALVAGVAPRGHRRRRGDLAVTAVGVGLGVSVGLGVQSVKHGLHLPGGMLLAAGTVAALAGTYLCLVLLLLISRLPWLEREVGHDRMVKLHRRVAPYSLVLVLAHVVLTTMSYAQAARHGTPAEFWRIVTRSAWMVPATTAFVLMMALGVMSARAIRSRMKYETWWVAHLYFYVAVALSFGHQLALGPMFVGHQAARVFWTGLYIAVAVAIVGARLVAPVALSLRHRLKVEAVVPEANGVVSVYLSGWDLDLLKARGGQFFQWRFLTRDHWWQAHPYSLSASPNPSWLRITAKDLGDHSSELRSLRPGTRVLAEGPYGVFTAAARHSDRVVAFAAGVGITPIRAVLEDLPPDAVVTIVHRVADEAHAPLRHELQELAADRGWSVHLLAGTRAQQPLTAERLAQLIPGLSSADVYVCGPDSFTSDVAATVRQLGVTERRIHHEAFSF